MEARVDQGCVVLFAEQKILRVLNDTSSTVFSLSPSCYRKKKTGFRDLSGVSGVRDRVMSESGRSVRTER